MSFCHKHITIPMLSQADKLMNTLVWCTSILCRSADDASMQELSEIQSIIQQVDAVTSTIATYPPAHQPPYHLCHEWSSSFQGCLTLQQFQGWPAMRPFSPMLQSNGLYKSLLCIATRHILADSITSTQLFTTQSKPHIPVIPPTPSHCNADILNAQSHDL